MIKFHNSSIELTKWLALIAMTIDHANRFFLIPANETAYEIGRIAMPLFTFIFSYNLANSSLSFPLPYIKAFKRILLFGTLATPGYMLMLHPQDILPLNIMFTFLVAAGVLFYIEKGGFFLIIAGAIFVFGSLFVEYFWAGILLCLAFWYLCKAYWLIALVTGFSGFYLLDILNGNHWGLITLPIILLISLLPPFKFPRIRYLFWIYYPLHLTVFGLISLL